MREKIVALRIKLSRAVDLFPEQEKNIYYWWGFWQCRIWHKAKKMIEN